MTTRLTFWGVAGYEVQGPEHRFLIDPFLTGNPYAPLSPDEVERPDAILVTHAAFDHLGDAAAIARRTGAPVVCGGDVRRLLLEAGVPSEQVRATVWGILTEVNGIVVRPVACQHWSQGTLADGTPISGVPMGFVVETEPGVRIYHYGDTAIFGDLRLIGELYRPTVGLLGCSQPQELLAQVPGPGRFLTGEMSPDEAALAAEMLGLDVAVACHYFDAGHADVAEFVRLVPERDSTGRRAAVAPEVGATLTVEARPDGGTDVSVEPPAGGHRA